MYFSRFSLTFKIRETDLQNLLGEDGLLNDEVINAYIGHLVEGHENVTTVLSLLFQSMEKGLVQVVPKIGIKDMLLVPVFQSRRHHWVLMTVDTHVNVPPVLIYDSLRKPNGKISKSFQTAVTRLLRSLKIKKVPYFYLCKPRGI